VAAALLQTEAASASEEKRLRKSRDSKTSKRTQEEARQKIKSRRDRFPSVEERVKIYMSNWYLPPCNERDRFLVSTNTTNSHVTINNMIFYPNITADQTFVWNESIILDCARSAR
jgi:hypothetical protein